MIAVRLLLMLFNLAKSAPPAPLSRNNVERYVGVVTVLVNAFSRHITNQAEMKSLPSRPPPSVEAVSAD